MYEEKKVSIIPGFNFTKNVIPPVATLKPRKRFTKAGENAEHSHTVRMRAIKSELRLTTPQLVSALNTYEREHQSHNFTNSTAIKAADNEGDLSVSDVQMPAWLPMNHDLMSSYLQGGVVQEQYMAQVAKRLENLLVYKKQQGDVAPENDIRHIMDAWYKTLGIDPNDGSSSQSRQLARIIAPYYKRPVLAPISGIFHLGKADEGVQTYTIIDVEGSTHTFTLNSNYPILFKNKQSVKAGEVIQYSVLMQTEKVIGETVLKQGPSIDHTTFYRWYASNRMPRSIQTLQLIQSAVDEAAKASS